MSEQKEVPTGEQKGVPTGEQKGVPAGEQKGVPTGEQKEVPMGEGPCPLCAKNAEGVLERIADNPGLEPKISYLLTKGHSFGTAAEWKKHIKAHPKCFVIKAMYRADAQEKIAAFKRELAIIHYESIKSGKMRPICAYCADGRDDHFADRNDQGKLEYKSAEDAMTYMREHTCDPSTIEGSYRYIYDQLWDAWRKIISYSRPSWLFSSV